MSGHAENSRFWISLEHDENFPVSIELDNETLVAIESIGQALNRIAGSLEYVAPMARWFFEHADLIFKPKED